MSIKREIMLNLPLTFEDRVNIVLVAEGIKGGSLDIPKSQTFLKMMEQLFDTLDLHHKKEERAKTFRLFFTKYEDELKRLDKKFTQRKKKIYTLGEFHGYPECCIKSFIKERSWSLKLPSYKVLIPYVYHEFCSPVCEDTQTLNEVIRKTIVRELGREYKLAFLLSKFAVRYNYWPHKICKLLCSERILRKRDKLRHTIEPFAPAGSPIYMKSVWIVEKLRKTIVYEAHLIKDNGRRFRKPYRCLFDIFKILKERDEKKDIMGVSYRKPLEIY